MQNSINNFDFIHMHMYEKKYFTFYSVTHELLLF